MLVLDWHREWHTREDQVKLFQGTAGMVCPLCGGTVLHGGWQVPLIAAPAGGSVETVRRNVVQAAYWAITSEGRPLTDYLKTPVGQPFALFWSTAEIHQAEQLVAANPLQP
jgi:hypothetical protein